MDTTKEKRVLRLEQKQSVSDLEERISKLEETIFKGVNRNG